MADKIPTFEETPMGCPFCGMEPMINQTVSQGWRIHCVNEKCPAIVTIFSTDRAACNALWNARKGVPRIAVLATSNQN